MSTSRLRPFGTQVSEISEIKTELQRSPLVLLRNLNLRRDDLLQVAASFSDEAGPLDKKLLHWEFGPMMEMKFDPEAKNYLFSQEPVPFHWDGAFHREPRFLVFYCVESAGDGGATLFAETEKIWQSFSPEEQKDLLQLRLRYTTEKKAHYGGDFEQALVRNHPWRNQTILRFAEEVETRLNPVQRTVSGGDRNWMEILKQKAYDPQFCYRHPWRTGDLLVADNFTLIHGREGLRENLSRSFQRIQVL